MLRSQRIERALDVLRQIRGCDYAEIMRDSMEGLEHVEALLRIRGVEIKHVPRKVPKHFRRGELTTSILRILRTGPRTGPEIVGEIASNKDGLSYRQAYICVYSALCRLKSKGMLVLNDEMWANVGLLE